MYGSWIPRQLFGRFTILLSTIRMLYICVCLFLTKQRFDIVFSDQVSATNMGVSLFSLARFKTVFYCHYPDVLLCTNRSSSLRRLYRIPFDWIEKKTTSMCDVLIVNSEFTANQLRQTFSNLKKKVHVLYPPVHISHTGGKQIEDTPFFFSLNRYERKKDLQLVVEEFHKINDKNVSLVIAGGFDSRLDENKEIYSELTQLISTLNLSKRVKLLQNISESDRLSYLTNALAVVYSPSMEHFGIVPIEAMAVGTPVIAWNNGGPKESILDGKTGFLCNERSDFSKHMNMIKREGKKKFEKECIKRVFDNFSLKRFSEKLHNIIK